MHVLNDYARAATLPAAFYDDVITISGATKVGSTATVAALLPLLGSPPWRHASAGAFMRQLAAEKGMEIEQLVAYARFHPELQYDLQCDAGMIEEAKQGYRLIDGRIQHAMIPQAFHVMLTCPREERAARLHKQVPQKPKEIHMANIIARDACDAARYRAQYPNCLWPETDFDFVIDTRSGSPYEIAQRILNAHQTWKRRVKLIQPVPA